MAIPNMAMIPSGYKPTKLYSVLPTPSLGSEAILNGDFSDGLNDWDSEEGIWTVSNGAANGNGATGPSQELGQSISASGILVGDTVKLSFEIKNYVGGSVQVVGATPSPNKSANGVYEYVGDITSTNIRFRGSAFNGSVTNVSVQKVIASDADFDVSRASSATRVNAQGLIETPEFIVSDELITNGDFSDGSNDWDLSGGSWTIANGVATFDGLNNAKRIFQSVSFVQNKNYKISFDVTQTDDDFISLFFGQNATQLIGTKNYKVGSYELYAEASVTTENLSIYAYNTTYGGGSVDNISVVQVEREDIPRLDYTDGGCPVLLTEPQSTNLMLVSEDLSDSKWTKGGTSVDSNSTTSPRGIADASKLVENTNNGAHNMYFNSPNTPVTSGLKYTMSFFAKTSGRNVRISNAAEIGVNVDYNLSNGTITSSGGSEDSSSISDYGNGWYRCTMSFTASTTIAQVNIAITDGVTLSYQGDGTSGAYIWGVQVEALSYATSYIPTYGAISTRASETITNAGDVNTFNSTEGTLFVEIEALVNGGSDRQISLSDSTNNNLVMFRYDTTSNRLTAFVRGNGGTYVVETLTSFTQTDNNKIALAWDSTNLSIWLNGVKDRTVSINDSPIGLSNLSLSAPLDADPFYGKTSQVQVFNTALSDSELQILTTI